VAVVKHYNHHFLGEIFLKGGPKLSLATIDQLDFFVIYFKTKDKHNLLRPTGSFSHILLCRFFIALTLPHLHEIPPKIAPSTLYTVRKNSFIFPYGHKRTEVTLEKRDIFAI
jgi:hypothetical protein